MASLAALLTGGLGPETGFPHAHKAHYGTYAHYHAC